MILWCQENYFSERSVVRTYHIEPTIKQVEIPDARCHISCYYSILLLFCEILTIDLSDINKNEVVDFSLPDNNLDTPFIIS